MNREQLSPNIKNDLEYLYNNLFMTQEEIAELLGVSQKAVWSFMKRNNIKARIAAKRYQMGAENDNWKGEKISYKGAHQRVRSIRGNPLKCVRCGTTEGKLEWASINKKYHDTDDYQSMCIPCHRKHDLFRRGQLVKKECPVCKKEWIICKSLEHQVCCSTKCAGEFKSLKLNHQDIIKLYKSGYTQKQIGQKYNISSKPIAKILKQHNIERIYRIPPNKVLHTIDVKKVRNLYSKGMNQESIAKIFNVSSQSISNFFKIHNIKSRNTGTKGFYHEHK